MQTLTHNDIAQRLCIGTGKARQLLRSGAMMVIEVADYGGGKKARRVTVEEFERWLREQEQKSAPKKPTRKRIIARKESGYVPKTIDEIFA